MFPGFNELFVKDYLHLLVKKFTTAVGQECILESRSPSVLRGKIFEIVRQLQHQDHVKKTPII